MKRSLALVFLICAFALSGFSQVSLTVVSGASFRPNFPVAPMSYVQAYGDFTGFPTANADLGSLPLATTLNGVQVLIDGTSCPMYAVNEQLVAFLVPQAVAPGRHQLQVTSGGQVVGQDNIDIAAFEPGIFFGFANDGTKLGGVRRASDNAYALSTSPVAKGGAIVIALTGQGTDLTGAVADGQAPSVQIDTVEKPEVWLNNIKLDDVFFSGLMPLFPGLWQINATVPADFPTSGPAALIVKYKDRTSNEVIIWVQ